MTSLLSASADLWQLLAAEQCEHQITSIGNINVVESDNVPGGKPIPICYMPYLLYFSKGDRVPLNELGRYEGLAAIFLAMEHLNTGNGTIVPELDGINERCPLRFTTDSFDTEQQKSVGVNHIINLTDKANACTQGTSKNLLPCAILGASFSSISMPTSTISGLRGFPQVSPTSTSPTLDDKSQFKLFGRTVPNDDGTSIPLLSQLLSWNVDYVAVLHVDDAYGNSFANGIRLEAQRNAPDLRVVPVSISSGADDAKVKEAVRALKQTKFTYFFGILHASMVDKVMTEAYNQGIAGTGKHTWLFGDSVGNTMIGRSFPVGSPLEKAYRGTGMLRASGGVPGMEAFDKLSKSMQQIRESKEDMSLLNAHYPTYSDGQPVNHSIITASEDFLSEPGISPFLYDAVIALGLAACELTSSSDNDEYFTGEELFQAFLNTTFEGTSGKIILDKETGTRDPQSAVFSLMNYVVDEDADVGADEVQFKGVESSLFKSGVWETRLAYTFNDGTALVPSDLPFLETETNYLSLGLKVVGFCLCSIIVVLAVGSSCWTYLNSKEHVVRVSQPIFLHIISAGTLFMGLSIIPLTIDLGVTDQNGADAACMSCPWLVAIGFSLTFSALFTKTHRVNEIMKSATKWKRMKLTPVDVIKPMVVLLIANVIVLTVWTVIDPLVRETIVVSEDAFNRHVETYSVCSSEYQAIFLAMLFVFNIGSLLYANIEAYKARKISTELQESSYIFIAMAIILLVSFMGVPVLVIANANSAAYYFVVVIIIFVVCSSILLLIFIPKVQATRKPNAELHRYEAGSSRPTATASTESADDSVPDFGMRVFNPMAAQAELEDEMRQLKRLTRVALATPNVRRMSDAEESIRALQALVK